MTFRKNPELFNNMDPRDICKVYAVNVLAALVIRIFADSPGKLMLRDISGKNLKSISNRSSYLNWLGSIIAFPAKQDFLEKDLKKNMKTASDRIFVTNFKDIHFPIADTANTPDVLNIIENVEVVLRRFSVYDSKIRDAIRGLKNLPEYSKNEVAAAVQDIIILMRRIDKESPYLDRLNRIHMQILAARDPDGLFEEDGGASGDGGATSAGDVSGDGGWNGTADNDGITGSDDIATFSFPMFYRNKAIKRKKKNFKKTPLLRRVKVKNNNK